MLVPRQSWVVPSARRHLRLRMTPSAPSAPIHALERGVASAVRTVSRLVGTAHVRLAADVARQDPLAADKIEISHHRI